MYAKLELKEKSRNALCAFFVVLIFISISLWVPLLGGLLMLVISTLRPYRVFILIGLCLVIFHFIVMNLNKTIENDLFWYSQQYIDNFNAPINEVFNDVRFGVIARVSEPVYHLFSYVISNVTGADFDVFVVLVTAVIYFFPLKAIYDFSNRADLKDYEMVSLLIFMLFFGIIFTQSLHLIRQYFACVFLLVGMMGLVRGDGRWAFVMFTVSCLTHTSMVIVVIIFYGCLYLNKSRLESDKVIVAAAILGGGISASYIALFLITGNGSRLLIEDGSVGMIVKMVDILILVISWVLFSRHRNKLERFLPLYAMYVSYCIFLIVAHYSIFLSLRYYFVLDFIRWIGFFIIIRSISFEKEKYAMMNVSLLILGFIYFWMRVLSSPFDYKYTVYEYLSGASSIY
jgi:hypothetical protein